MFAMSLLYSLLPQHRLHCLCTARDLDALYFPVLHSKLHVTVPSHYYTEISANNSVNPPFFIFSQTLLPDFTINLQRENNRLTNSALNMFS